MKKVMIALAAVALAVTAQAATVNWQSGTIFIASDAAGTTGSGNSYRANANTALREVTKDYGVALEKLQYFYDKFSALWYKENKPHGFDVQDIRLGGLMQRLKACQNRLNAYLGGSLEKIEELDEKLLDWFCDGNNHENETPSVNNWAHAASLNIL